MSDTLLDVKGLNCPLPVLRANKVLRGMAAGEKLRVLATDPAAIGDFRDFCKHTGHALVGTSVYDYVDAHNATATRRL